MGGLFGDLPPPSDAATPAGDPAGKGGWSVASRMAPPAALKPMFAPPSALRRAQGSSATKQQSQSQLQSQQQSQPQPQSLLQSQSQEQQRRSDPDRSVSSNSAESGPDSLAVPDGAPGLGAAPAGALVAATAAVVDEYDPARPNDYEEILRERKRKRVEEERERERERLRREVEEREREREMELERQREVQLAMQKEKERAAAVMAAAGASPAASEDRPGSLRMSGEDAWRRRAMLSGASLPPPPPLAPSAESEPEVPARQEEPQPPSKPLTAAERMMMKMGWKAGQGLGKQEQGITTPLMAKKTDKRAGVIVNAPEKKKGGQPGGSPVAGTVAGGVALGNAAAKPPGSGIPGPPTKVVLLRNMVGPGEVDEELEEEVAGECQKYGEVARVLIFEVTEAGFPAAEAVRIFIGFQRVESAVKAAVDLDGRFFGGKPVKATYFSEDRFQQRDLAPSLEELQQMAP